MPHLTWTATAIRDLQRAFEFLAEKDRRAAQAAIRRIRSELRKMAAAPELGRPVSSGSRSRREWVIPFGDSGCIAQYESQGKNVLILRLRHQRQKPLKRI
jgi:plasmid stabilization system protein ParE